MNNQSISSKLERTVRKLRGELTSEDEILELEDEASDLLERLQNGKELTPKQQKALLNLLKHALQESE